MGSSLEVAPWVWQFRTGISSFCLKSPGLVRFKHTEPSKGNATDFPHYGSIYNHQNLWGTAHFLGVTEHTAASIRAKTVLVITKCAWHPPLTPQHQNTPTHTHKTLTTTCKGYVEAITLLKSHYLSFFILSFYHFIYHFIFFFLFPHFPIFWKVPPISPVLFVRCHFSFFLSLANKMVTSTN